MGGLEFNQYTYLDNAYTAIDDDDVLYQDDELQGLYTTYGQMKTSTLLSAYFSVGIAPSFNIFFRSDIYNPNNTLNPELENKNLLPFLQEQSETHVLIGVHFSPFNKINLAPLIRYNILELSDDPSIDFMVHFEFKF